LLAAYVSDDLVHEMIEGEPDIIGKSASIETLGPPLTGFHTVDMKILRHFAVAGNWSSPSTSIR